MKRNVIIAFSILLLLFNDIGACYGSLKFITDPSGASMGIPLSMLKHSPFSNYLIPGIILLIANGLMSFIVILLTLLKLRIYPYAIIGEGSVLFGWITIQVLLLQTIAGLHIALWFVALMLIALGLVLRKQEFARSGGSNII